MINGTVVKINERFGWKWFQEPFTSYRVGNRSHNLILPTMGCTESTAQSQIRITREKGTRLLVPCKPAKNQRIALIAVEGKVKGSPIEVTAKGCKILLENYGVIMNKPFAYLVVDYYLMSDDGYITTKVEGEFGVEYEILYWNSSKKMSKLDYECWQALKSSIQNDTALKRELSKLPPGIKKGEMFVAAAGMSTSSYLR